MGRGKALAFGVVFLSTVLDTPVAVAQNASPASDGTHLGIGAGLVVPQDPGVDTLDTTLWITANVRIRLGDHLWLEPEVGYWQREPDRNLTLSRVVNLGANLLLSSQGRCLRVWAGAGLGLHLLIYRPESSDTFGNLAVRAQLLAGVDYSFSARTTLFGAGRLDTSFLPEDDDLARQWKLYVGLRWRL